MKQRYTRRANTLRNFAEQIKSRIDSDVRTRELRSPFLGARIGERVQPNGETHPEIILGIQRGTGVKFYTLPCQDLSGPSIILKELVWKEDVLEEYRTPNGIRKLQKIITEQATKRVLLLEGDGVHKICTRAGASEIMVSGNQAFLMSGKCTEAVFIAQPTTGASKGVDQKWRNTFLHHLQLNRRMLLVVLAALSPVLGKLMDRKPPAIVLVGPSSIGKTTLLRIAQSVYSKSTVVPTLSGTSLGLREAAAKNPGHLSIFDEISSADDPSVLIDLLFDAEGQSTRLRATVGTTISTPQMQIDTTLLFANEFGVAESLASHARSGTTGAWARVLEVRPHPQHGMFNKIPRGIQASAFADRLDRGAREHGGALWHPWLKYIGEKTTVCRQEWAARLNTIERNLSVELNPTDSVQQRLIHSAAIWVLTGEIAGDAGVLPIAKDAHFKAVKLLLSMYLKRFSQGPQSEQLIRPIASAIGKLRHQIKDWPRGSRPLVHHTRKTVGGSQCILLLPEALGSVLGRGEKRTNTLKALEKAGLLKCFQKTWASQFSWPDGTKPRFYVFDQRILSWE